MRLCGINVRKLSERTGIPVNPTTLEGVDLAVRGLLLHFNELDFGLRGFFPILPDTSVISSSRGANRYACAFSNYDNDVVLAFQKSPDAVFMSVELFPGDSKYRSCLETDLRSLEGE